MSKELTTPNKATELSGEDQKIVDEAVKFINEKANETIYKGHEEIGSYILENFFNNNIEKALSKDPTKKISFNTLCKREDLVIHPNTLARAVKVSCQEKIFLDKKLDVTPLSYTHKALLVKIEKPTIKINMAKKCIKESWSTRKLDEAIKKKLKSLKTPQDKSLIRITQKCIKRIETVIETVGESDFSFESEELLRMSGTKRRELIKHANDLKSKIIEIKLDDVSKNCESLIEELKKIEEEYKKNPPKRGRASSKNAESEDKK